jgi:hypothetical protein
MNKRHTVSRTPSGLHRSVCTLVLRYDPLTVITTHVTCEVVTLQALALHGCTAVVQQQQLRISDLPGRQKL